MRDKRNLLAVVLLAGFVLLAYGSSDSGGGGGSESSSSGETGGESGGDTSASAEKEKVPDPEFVTVRKDHCTKYKDASNEIKKSNVFTEYTELAKAAGYTVEDLECTVAGIDTPQGGGEVWLEVNTPFGKFTNSLPMEEIFDSPRAVKKGTALYNTIGEFEEGAKVRISASMIIPSPNPFSEKLSVCGDDWIVKYTKVEPIE